MTSLIPQIATIIRNYGMKTGNRQWEKAATLQDLWLSFDAHVSRPIAPERFDYSVQAWPAQTGITIDWILRDDVQVDGRAQTAFMMIQATAVSDEDGEVARKIQQLAVELFASTSANAVELGTLRLKPGINLQAFHAQRALAQAVLTDYTLTPLDPLMGTLGSFNFYAIPVGRVRKLPDGLAKVEITEFVFYVMDSFDFEGIQPLGFFKAPDGISKDPFDGGTGISNADYTAYRASVDANGKGGDFLVVTDTRVVPLSKTFTFSPAATLNGTWKSNDAKGRFLLAINGGSVEWTETGMETGLVANRALNVAKLTNGWRIERPNADPEILKMLGFKDATLQQAILAHGPRPSFLHLKLENNVISARWSGIRVRKTPQGTFESLVQPDDPSNSSIDYTFTRFGA